VCLHMSRWLSCLPLVIVVVFMVMFFMVMFFMVVFVVFMVMFMVVFGVPGWRPVVLHRHRQDRLGHVLMGYEGPRPVMG
jgi:hypothetical protein